MEEGVMPKETIQHFNDHACWHDRDDASPDEVPSPDAYRTASSLEVRWNRDMEWVQLALGRAKWVPEQEYWDETDADSYYTDVLSREEINKLIRTLRRARDAAYGADA